MEVNQHRTWAEIDLGAIEHNYRVICEQAQAPVLCVVKADAYGHGAVQVAKRLEKMGAPYFAVATIPEGVELREAGIETPISALAMWTRRRWTRRHRRHHRAGVRPRDSRTHQRGSRAHRQAGHCTLQAGYRHDAARLSSWECEQTVQDILACSKLPGLISEGIFTHFAVADVPSGEAYTELQYKRFSDVCEGLQAAGLDLPLRHCANSGAIQTYEKMHCTMTRAGIILYGYRPDASVPPVLDLRPAMTVKARVVQVRDIPANTTISYGRTFETAEPTHMAVISMGYADGYLRTGSGKAQVLLGGVKAPVLGRICMDMCMVRIPEGVDVHRGDEVTVFGPEGWTAEDAADAAGTISYEVLCAISRRVPRFYR